MMVTAFIVGLAIVAFFALIGAEYIGQDPFFIKTLIVLAGIAPMIGLFVVESIKTRTIRAWKVVAVVASLLCAFHVIGEPILAAPILILSAYALRPVVAPKMLAIWSALIALAVNIDDDGSMFAMSAIRALFPDTAIEGTLRDGKEVFAQDLQASSPFHTPYSTAALTGICVYVVTTGRPFIASP